MSFVAKKLVKMMMGIPKIWSQTLPKTCKYPSVAQVNMYVDWFIRSAIVSIGNAFA